MTALERKRQYRAYRLAARGLYQKGLITVDEDATVHMLAEGAYVQMTVWVPKDALTPEVYEAVMTHERERTPK